MIKSSFKHFINHAIINIFYTMGGRTMNIIETIFRLKANREALDINSAERFHAVLKSERFRSDRINKGFSIILFNFSNALKSPDYLISFMNIMDYRCVVFYVRQL